MGKAVIDIDANGQGVGDEMKPSSGGVRIDLTTFRKISAS